MNYLKLSYRRWLAWLALAALFAVACALLSNWQFARRAQVLAVIKQLDANYSVSPISLSQVQSAENQKWMPVTLTGNYLPSLNLLVRNRSQNGNPGFEQLVPFQTESSIVFIDRGWVPTGNHQDSPDLNPLPPTTSMQIVGHVMPSEPRLDRSAPLGQIATVSLYLAAHELQLKPSEVQRSFYLILSDESIKTVNQPIRLPKPELDEGNHLSYALQWILFALMAFAALVWAIRKEFEEYRIANEPGYQPRKRRVTRIGSDENAEDRLIDEATNSKK